MAEETMYRWNKINPAKRKICLAAAICLLSIPVAYWAIHAVYSAQGVSRHVPPGFISKEEHFDPGGFQDYTDYCKYRYASMEPFQRDDRYHEISSDEGAVTVAGYFEDFTGWMRAGNRLNEYDFDTAYINQGDYVLILTKEGQAIGNSAYGKYDHYSVYFFDAESLTLYYIHNNI